MTEPISPVENPALIGREHRAEIVDRLYEVALDPIRLQDLMEVWEVRIGPTRSSDVADAVQMEDEELEAHLRRATVFLDRFEATRSDQVYRSVLEDIPRSAAFLSDGGPGIAAFNRPAAIAFGLKDGAALTDLPFDREDVDVLRGVIHAVATGRAERVITLRLRSKVTDSPVILRVGPIESDNTRPLALIMSTERVWPEGFEMMVQEAFGLTSAEVDIVRGITLGLPVKDIAEARGRSAETVRTQLRSILAKTETHSQSELVRVVLGLMDLAQMPTEGAGPVPRVGTLEQLSFQQMKTTDGRRLEWIEFGSPTGAPCLFMHLDYGFIRWPATAERAARMRGMRVIVPVRAGYGRSDPHPRGADHLEWVTQDYLSVLDYLGVRRCAILTMGADLRFALDLSIKRDGLVSAILACAGQLPLRSAAQYDRMDKWQRFILANARYAPKILPFLVQAGFSLARKLGKEKFFAQMNGGSAADLEAFGRAEVREALLAGSEISLGAKILAHEAFTRECIGSEKDWSHLLRAVTVPVQMLQGDQDPQTPVQTIEELRGEYPHLEISYLPNTGQLLFFAEWPLVLDVLEKYLPRR